MLSVPEAKKPKYGHHYPICPTRVHMSQIFMVVTLRPDVLCGKAGLETYLIWGRVTLKYDI